MKSQPAPFSDSDKEHTHTSPDPLIIISSGAKQKKRKVPPSFPAAYLLVLVARSEVKSVVRRKNRSRPYQVIRELLSSASLLDVAPLAEIA